MNVHTYNPDALTKKTVIPLGRACECQATRIDFLVSSWLERFPGGSIALYIKDPNEVLYLAAVTVAGGVASWVLHESDTTTPGFGSLELALIGANGEKKLSAVASTEMDASLALEEPGEAPEYAAPWIEQAAKHQASTEMAARNAAADAKTALQAAENATESANAAATSETAAEESKAAAAQAAADASISERNAEESANRSEMAAAASGWLDMAINEAGHLIYTRSESVDAIDFELQEGRLLVNYG